MSVMVTADISTARRLTERIRLVAVTVSENIDKLKSLVTEAKESGAHTALGYASWPAYLADVLGETPLRLERDVRQELTAELSRQGMSTRSIAPIFGVDQATVARDIGRDANASPDRARHVEPTDEQWQAYADGMANPDTGEILESEPPRTIAGMDGKTYKVPTPKPKPEGNTSPDLTLVNDIRLYLRKLATSPQVSRLTPAGKQHIITALQDAITQIERNQS